MVVISARMERDSAESGIGAAAMGRIFQVDTHCNDSFGPIGSITKVADDRLKGFLTAPVRNGHDLQTLTDIVSAGITELERTGTTRLTVRSVVVGNLLDNLVESLEESGARVEAAIPLRNGEFLAYIGYNGQSRRSPPEALERNRGVRLTAETRSRLRRDASVDPTISVEIVNNRIPSEVRLADTEVSALVSMMHEGFGYSEGAAEAVLSDPRNIISIVRREGLIVGMNVTEVREIPLTDGTTLRMAEITDCYVIERYRHNGYHSTLLRILMDQHLQELDVVFTESNAENQAMVNSALSLGHIIAGDGRRIPGILELHAEIEDTSGNLELRDLFVTYLPNTQ